MEEEIKIKLTLINRQKLSIDGVRLVDRFDEEEILLETKMGPLFLKGSNLHITGLDLERGGLTAEGLFTGLQFREEGSGQKMRVKGKGILGKLLK